MLLILLIVVVLAYISRTHKLAGKVATLEQQIARLVSSPPLSQPASAPINQIVATPAAQPLSVSEPLVVPSTAMTVIREPLPEAGSVVARSREEWEMLVGGKLLNRIGAFALVIGIGFFLKYAFDNNWITPIMRVLIGLLIGSGLLAGGERAKHKNWEMFAPGLVGAGLAILYLTVYASYNFYQLVAHPLAMVAMSIVTMLAFIQALRYDALAISLLGWAGGFLTPFLLANDQSSALGLFSYIVLLDIGLLAVVLRRDSWIVLEFLTRFATYMVYGIWYINEYTSAQFGLAVLFLSSFWALFYLLHLVHVFQNSSSRMDLRNLGAVVNTLVFYATVYSLVAPLYPDWIAAVTLALGLPYFGTAVLCIHRRPKHVDVHAQYALSAMVALVLATTLHFSPLPTVIAWSIEALALLWCGQRWKLDYVRYPALGLFAIASIRLLNIPGALFYTPIEAFTPLLNERALVFAVLILALGASTLLFRDQTDPHEKGLAASVHTAWSVLLLVLLTVEINDWFRLQLENVTGDQTIVLRYLRLLVIGVIWMIYTLPLVKAGKDTASQALMYVGALTGLAAIQLVAFTGLTFEPITHFQLVLNARVATFLLVIAGAWLNTHWLRYRPQLYMPRLGYILCALLIFELISVEARDVFERQIALTSAETPWQTLNRLQNLQQLAISSVWLVYASILIGLGFWRRVPGLRIGAILLAGVTILKIFVYDLAFLETLYRIFSFIGLGVLLLGVSFLYQRYKAVIFGQPVHSTAE